MTKLLLIRGLPGSGKSTLAKLLLSTGAYQSHYEADMYFCTPEGEYNFNPIKLSLAHKWCLEMTTEALKTGKSVVVSNTFSQLWEMAKYIQLAKNNNYDLQVIECQSNYGNIHNVPESVLVQMSKRWEKYNESL